MTINRAYNQMTFPADSIGGFSVSSFSSRTFVPPPSLNYNETPYIRALNRALELEQAAISLYAAKQRTTSQNERQGASAIDRTDSHHAALRHLVRLIFAQRGLPNKDPSGLMAVTGTVAAKVSRYMPPMVQDPMLGASAHRVEMALARRYRQLLAIAPESDLGLLRSLLRQVCEFSEQA